MREERVGMEGGGNMRERAGTHAEEALFTTRGGLWSPGRRRRTPSYGHGDNRVAEGRQLHCGTKKYIKAALVIVDS